jgi:hypothetical protein
MSQYIAKPNTMNSADSKVFSNMFDARDYLNEFTETLIKFSVDEWIILNKIFEVKEDGKLIRPEKFPKIRKGKEVWIKFDEKKFL